LLGRDPQRRSVPEKEDKDVAAQREAGWSRGGMFKQDPTGPWRCSCGNQNVAGAARCEAAGCDRFFCLHCGMIGHQIKFCRQLPRSEQQALYAQSPSPNPSAPNAPSPSGSESAAAVPGGAWDQSAATWDQSAAAWDPSAAQAWGAGDWWAAQWYQAAQWEQAAQQAAWDQAAWQQVAAWYPPQAAAAAAFSSQAEPSASAPQLSNRIYVGGIPPLTPDSALREAFEPFGQVPMGYSFAVYACVRAVRPACVRQALMPLSPCMLACLWSTSADATVSPSDFRPASAAKPPRYDAGQRSLRVRAPQLTRPSAHVVRYC
jgi:hypothetical protein